MPPKINPAKLNPLQLKTLTLLQAIARLPDASKPTPEGDTEITAFPHAHGDHFHLGRSCRVVARRHRSGEPECVECPDPQGPAQERVAAQIALTPEGAAYDTGIADQVLHPGGHH